MLSIAFENFVDIKSEMGIELDVQEIIGVIHCGLSPFFFKSVLSKEYLIWLQNFHDPKESTSNEIPPELVLTYYKPFKDPYNDHEWTTTI